MGYSGTAAPNFPYAAAPGPEAPEVGQWPVASFYTLMQDLAMGITLDQRGYGGIGVSSGAVAQTIGLRWEQSLTLSLFDSAVCGRSSIVEVTLDQKADPNTIERETGVTALHLAAAYGDSPDVIRLLDRKGAKLDAMDTNGRTPLLRALQTSHPQSAVCLMWLRADPAKVDHSHRRDALYAALQYAPQDPAALSDRRQATKEAIRTFGEYVQLTKKLVEAASLPDNDEPPPSGGFFGLADFFSSPEPTAPAASDEAVANQLRSAAFVCVSNGWSDGLNVLIQAGANPNHRDKKSRRTLLELADALIDHDVANVLRSYGAAEHDRDDHAEWGLCLAAARGDWSAAVEWGRVADLDWRENPPSDRLSALQYAAVEGHGDIARLLLKAGHSVDLLDARGLSAVDMARERGHRALADYLQQLDTDSHWMRAEDLARERGGKATDYLPAVDSPAGVDGYSWPVLRDLLMPPPGREIPWSETGRQEIQYVYEANVDTSRLKVEVISCRNLVAGSFQYSLDAYVQVKIRTQKYETAVIQSANPMFNAIFEFQVRPRDMLTFVVFDQDRGLLGLGSGSEPLGRLDVPLSKYRNELTAGRLVEIKEKLNHTIDKEAGMMIIANLSYDFREETVEKIVDVPLFR